MRTSVCMPHIKNTHLPLTTDCNRTNANNPLVPSNQPHLAADALDQEVTRVMPCSRILQISRLHSKGQLQIMSSIGRYLHQECSATILQLYRDREREEENFSD